MALTGGILDTRNTIGVPIFEGTDANWESWRVKFEAYADLAGMGTLQNKHPSSRMMVWTRIVSRWAKQSRSVKAMLYLDSGKRPHRCRRTGRGWLWRHLKGESWNAAEVGRCAGAGRLH